MITSMKGCAMLNNLVPWPLSSRSLSHDFAIKLLKYSHLVVSALQHVQFWMDSFHIGHKWSLAWDGELHIMTYDLWSWPISFRSFSHDFAIKMLKYDGISCCLHYSMYSSGWIFPIWHKWSLVWEGEGVLHATALDLWSWPISSRSFSNDFAIKLL